MYQCNIIETIPKTTLSNRKIDIRNANRTYHSQNDSNKAFRRQWTYPAFSFGNPPYPYIFAARFKN